MSGVPGLSLAWARSWPCSTEWDREASPPGCQEVVLHQKSECPPCPGPCPRPGPLHCLTASHDNPLKCRHWSSPTSHREFRSLEGSVSDQDPQPISARARILFQFVRPGAGILITSPQLSPSFILLFPPFPSPVCLPSPFSTPTPPPSPPSPLSPSFSAISLPSFSLPFIMERMLCGKEKPRAPLITHGLCWNYFPYHSL